MSSSTWQQGAVSLLSGTSWRLQAVDPLPETEPDRNDAAPPRQRSFGKTAATFLIVGPPIFFPSFYLAANLATRNGDTIHVKIDETFGVVLSPYGLLAIVPQGVV